MTLQEWKEVVAKKYGTTWLYVVPDESDSAKAYSAIRNKLGTAISPWKCMYSVYDSLLRSQRQDSVRGV